MQSRNDQRPCAAASSLDEENDPENLRALAFHASFLSRRRNTWAALPSNISAHSWLTTTPGAVALHSFTPTFLGVNRPWHLGVLYHRDARLSQILLDLLRREEGVIVGENEPYAMGDETDYTLVVHGEQRGIPHAELEVRQDLIAAVAGQTVWARRLARLLGEAARILIPRCEVFPRHQ